MFGLQIEYPECDEDEEFEKAVVARVRDIIARGKIAVFTRPHRILGSYLVVKRVTNPELDELGDLESDNGYVAPWDKTYTLTEKEPT